MNDIAQEHPADSPVRQFRLERGETLEEFGQHIGLSAGKVSELERGLIGASVRVALAIEELSARRIDAASLSEDVRDSRRACIEGCASDARRAGEAA